MDVRPAAAIMIIALLAGGCGTGGGNIAGSQSGEAPLALSCGGTGEHFDASYANGPEMTPEDLATTEVGEALAAELVLGEAAVEGGSFRYATGFSVPSDTLVLGYQDGAISSAYVLDDDGNLRQWGGCNPTYVRGDQVATRWLPSGAIETTATTVPINVSGGGCVTDTGTEIVTKIESIDVAEHADSVDVTVWTSRQSSSSSMCAGVGLDLPAEIELTAPLGDRTLVDAGVIPPIRHAHEITGALGTYTCGSAYMEMSSASIPNDAVGDPTPEVAAERFLASLEAPLTMDVISSTDANVVFGFTNDAGYLVAGAFIQRINDSWILVSSERCASFPKNR